MAVPKKKDKDYLSEEILVRKSADLISLHFGLSTDSGLDSCKSTNELEQRLAKIINLLLDKDFQALLNIFYRLDISEVKLKKILSQGVPGSMGELLAREVIVREKEKVLTRHKYREM